MMRPMLASAFNKVPYHNTLLNWLRLGSLAPLTALHQALIHSKYTTSYVTHEAKGRHLSFKRSRLGFCLFFVFMLNIFVGYDRNVHVILQQLPSLHLLTDDLQWLLIRGKKNSKLRTGIGSFVTILPQFSFLQCRANGAFSPYLTPSPSPAWSIWKMFPFPLSISCSAMKITAPFPRPFCTPTTHWHISTTQTEVWISKSRFWCV